MFYEDDKIKVEKDGTVPVAQLKHIDTRMDTNAIRLVLCVVLFQVRCGKRSTGVQKKIGAIPKWILK